MSDILGPANAANAVTTRIAETRVFPTTDTWFKPCSTPAAQDGTQIQSLFLNGLLAQLRAAIRGNGLKNDGVTPIIAENNVNDAMLLGAIQQIVQRGQCNFVPDTGTADAMVVAPAPALAEYEVGLRLLVLKNPLVAANATTTPTINAGLGAVTLVKCDGSVLGIGDLKKGGLFEIELNGANPARLVSLLTISDILALLTTNVPPLVTNSPAALPPSVYLYPGTYTVTVPAGATKCDSQIWGGGGGSGGVGSTGNGSGSGGGSGSYSRKAVTGLMAGQTITLVVGAQGAAGGPGGGGGSGGTTSFGSFHSAPGGGGGSPNGVGTGGAGGATPTGGDVNLPGNAGTAGAISGTAFGGPGGGAPYGSGGGGAGVGIGGPGPSPGGGGGGSGSSTAQGGALGGAGAAILKWS